MNATTYQYKHYSVLLNEVITNLAIKSNGVYVDATLGLGGHSSAILANLNSDGKLFSFDQDDQNINYVLNKNKTLKIINNELIFANFKQLEYQLNLRNVLKVNGILFDLGVCSTHFDNAERGFSYRLNGPLDMRMNKSQSLSAKTIVNEYDEQALIKILRQYGDVRFADLIVKNIIKTRKTKLIKTTFELNDVIKQALPNTYLRKTKHPSKKVFQALRIATNDELKILNKALHQAVHLLKPDGRLAVITFHSLEDRLVKNFFKKLTIIQQNSKLDKLPTIQNIKPKYELITPKPIIPQKLELELNPRSRSAKLRILKKL